MAGSLKTLNIYQNGSSIYNASTFTSYGIWTDGNKIYKTNNHTPQSGDTELVTLTTAISGLYHNADGEQVNVGLNTVLVITTLAATDIIVYCLNASSKTTLDLSTLSDIADGAHTVKVKAKADGYRDSEFSNEVNYTKVAVGVDVYAAAYGEGSTHDTYMKIGQPPTSPSDYTYGTNTIKSGIHNVSVLINNSGAQLSEPQKATLPLYVWGFGYYDNDLQSWNALNDSSYDEYVMITDNNITKIYLGTQKGL